MSGQPQKVVLITGASSGMGRATAEYLQKNGYRVYGTARRPEKYRTAFPLLRLDYTDDDSMQLALDFIREKEGRLDVLINNGGRGMIGPLTETPATDLEMLFRTNTIGPVVLAGKALPLLTASRGIIINISSIAGFTGLPFRGAYSASKAALMILSETLRLELHGTGVRVTDIAPGDFRTEIASKRFYVPNRKGSPYYAHYQRILDQIDREVDKGFPPRAMAKLIGRILETDRPKSQYRIGPWSQKILPLAKALLPASWLEYVILKMYDLN